MCQKILACDRRVMYAGYMERDGKISGEATKSSIAVFDKLSIMRLPINSPGGAALVLAVPTGSDLAEIVAKAKQQLSA
jgi:hypothetical protein